jgi:hypothetical protein
MIKRRIRWSISYIVVVLLGSGKSGAEREKGENKTNAGLLAIRGIEVVPN